MTSRGRSVIALLIGVILIQAAWIVAVPPFRGSDEFDHAYRADGVAHGQWRLNERAENGRGLLVRVDGPLVAAASAQCDALSYPGRDNCFPVKRLADGTVLIATAAAPYNPAFYVVPGAAGALFDGAASLYAMRAASGLLFALILAAAWWALTVSSAGQWARLGFLAGLTPIVLYSSIIPAPNGLEMAMGALLWTALLGAATTRVKERWVRPTLIVLAGASGACLMMLRALGPVWVTLIVLALVAVIGGRKTLSTLRKSSRWWAIATAAVVAAFGVGLVWNLSAGLLGPSPDGASADTAQTQNWVARVIVWTMQMVGAFPLHDEPAPAAVYAMYFVVVAALCALALFGSRRRLAVALLCLAPLTIPVLLTLATSGAQGVIWQGRYQAPFTIGLLMAFGWLLDQRKVLYREVQKVTAVLMAILAASHAWSVVSVASGESRREASSMDDNWFQAAPIVLAVLVVAGAAAWGIALVLLRSQLEAQRLTQESSTLAD